MFRVRTSRKGRLSSKQPQRPRKPLGPKHKADKRCNMLEYLHKTHRQHILLEYLHKTHRQHILLEPLPRQHKRHILLGLLHR